MGFSPSVLYPPTAFLRGHFTSSCLSFSTCEVRVKYLHCLFRNMVRIEIYFKCWDEWSKDCKVLNLSKRRQITRHYFGNDKLTRPTPHPLCFCRCARADPVASDFTPWQCCLFCASRGHRCYVAVF